MKIEPTQTFLDQLRRKFYVSDPDYVVGYIAHQIKHGLADELKPGVLMVWIYGIPAYVILAGKALVGLRYVQY